MKKYVVLLACMCMTLGGGGSISSQAETETLCACAQYPDGTLNMHLTQECMDMVLKKFGPSLEGMETWYQEHCNMKFTHPKSGAKSEKEVQS